MTNRDKYLYGRHDFDDVADIFYRETGCMRPGKDDARGCHTRDERCKRWELWLDEQAKGTK